MKRILIFGESAALSHIGRPYILAKMLAENNYEVHFACDDKYTNLLSFANITYHKIYSQPQKKFLRNLKYGLPLISKRNLKKYIKDELNLIDKTEPEVIIGDLRLSLSISARIKNIPYINIINAHWSTFAVKKNLLGDHPLTKILGYKASQKLYDLTAASTTQRQLSGINRLRKENNYEEYNSMEEFLTDGDMTFFPDIKELITLSCLPENHYFIGPINFEPQTKFPEWFKHLPKDKKIIYLSFGSTGNISAQATINETLSEIDVIVLYATAGIKYKKSYPKNFYVTEYLPGSEVCKIADLTISNGGIQSIHQSLLAHTPIIGLCVNIDQLICMKTIEDRGFGKIIRSDQIKKDYLKLNIEEYLNNNAYAVNIKKFMQNIPLDDIKDIVIKILE